jgi:integrase
MPVYYVQSHARWRFEFNRVIRGRRVRTTKLLPAGWSRNQAEKYDREETARYYAVATGVEQTEPTIGEAVGLYLDHRIPKLQRGKRTAQELAHLYDYIDRRPISHLSEVCREYAKENPGLAPATIRNRLAYLRAACRYAWRKHKLTALDPTGQMELPSVDNARDVRVPVAVYEKKVLGAIEDREALALFTLTFYTGSRWQSEILPRTAADVHRVDGEVLLEVGRTKNGSPRLVPVHPKALWALDYLPFKHGARYFYDRFREAREAAGLPGLWIHDGRHIVATDIIRRGGSLPDVSAALHHKSLMSSARYAHVVTEHTKRVLFSIGEKTPYGKIHTRRRKARKKKAA